ncbi:hypothetical protein QTN47_19045 [Danxiaibacter flavus]|uniref:Carboxypeptidase regulatory-like domain-containing protein n=1 Tax=Danxiaibacter flavus TaxID=3049108 RepID=A0ABV3ZKE2_9BACT|nr:hypothetical protein QNM32_19055 [Chitinophagaceae bacterium DXS]
MKHLALLLFLSLVTVFCFGQLDELNQRILNWNSINTDRPREKLFIHYDKPFYRINDTIWLKGYLLTANENLGSDSSRIAYIEIINAQDEVIKRVSTPCYGGNFYSNITLSQDDFKQGNYLLRAYTKWMRNFGDALFFESRFKIIDPSSGEWAIAFKEFQFQNNRLSLSANLKNRENQTLSNKRVNIRLRSNKKDLFQTRMTTDYSGNLFIDTLLTNVPEKKDLVFQIFDKGNLLVQAPVKSNDKQYVDLQFLPEGGTFIAGKEQKLGFKALNVYGKGTEVKGVIKNSKGQEVTSFASAFKGMGVVSFTPELNQLYTAFLENGSMFSLPSPQPSGTLLRVTDDGDSLAIKVDASPDLAGKRFFIVASMRGLIHARGSLRPPYELKIAKKVFSSGVVHITLYDETAKPVNERSVFVWHNDALKLNLSSHKPAYGIKDSVQLALKVTDVNNGYIPGHFSMAVIDTSQVSVAENMENLLSYMLLSSDLKGTIEEPYYYIKNSRSAATDALMLTQGWVSYNWDNSSWAYQHETAFAVTGKVSNIFNKPFKNSSVTLFGKEGWRDAFFLDTVTNDEGVFTFANFPEFTKDSVSLVIRALNKKGKAFNVGIDLEPPTYPLYSSEKIAFSGDNILFDTIAKQYINTRTKMVEQMKAEGNFLQEVVVTAKARIPGSKNLNENGGSDETITEKMLDKTPKETLLDVLKAKVTGFRLGTPPKSFQWCYLINSNVVRFIIDGVDLHFFYQPTAATFNDYLLFLDSYLKYFSAEDIKGIEIMNRPQYNSAYKASYLTPAERMNSSPVTVDFSFVEITTKTGQGPFLKKTPGMYLYKPLAPVFGKQFYSPRYSLPEEKTIFPDLRSTVYWNPEIITNEKGEANVSFYTSESKGGYVIVLQGVGFNGGMGVLSMPLNVMGEIKK